MTWTRCTFNRPMHVGVCERSGSSLSQLDLLPCPSPLPSLRHHHPREEQADPGDSGEQEEERQPDRPLARGEEGLQWRCEVKEGLEAISLETGREVRGNQTRPGEVVIEDQV